MQSQENNIDLIKNLQNSFNLDLNKINELIKKELIQILERTNKENRNDDLSLKTEKTMHLILSNEFDNVFSNKLSIFDINEKLKKEITEKNLKFELLTFDEMMECNKQMLFFKKNKENYNFPIFDGHYFVLLKNKDYKNIIHSVFILAFDVFSSKFILQKKELWIDFIKSFKKTYPEFAKKFNDIKIFCKNLDEVEYKLNHFIKTELKDDFYLLKYNRKNCAMEKQNDGELWVDVVNKKNEVEHKLNINFLEKIFLKTFSIEIQKEALFCFNISHILNINTKEKLFEITITPMDLP